VEFSFGQVPQRFPRPAGSPYPGLVKAFGRTQSSARDCIRSFSVLLISLFYNAVFSLYYPCILLQRASRQSRLRVLLRPSRSSPPLEVIVDFLTDVGHGPGKMTGLTGAGTFSGPLPLEFPLKVTARTWPKIRPGPSDLASSGRAGVRNCVHGTVISFFRPELTVGRFLPHLRISIHFFRRAPTAAGQVF